MMEEIELVRHPETGELIQEEWRDISGYEGLYQVSNYGRVKSLAKIIIRKNGRPHTWGEKILSSKINSKLGYKMITLYNIMNHESFYIHRLVAKYFIPNPDILSQVNHKNGIRDFNFYLNLEWVSNRENATHTLNRAKTSRFKGVSRAGRKKEKWQAGIYIDGKSYCLGSRFNTEEEAHQAYLDAHKKYGIKNKYAV